MKVREAVGRRTQQHHRILCRKVAQGPILDFDYLNRLSNGAGTVMQAIPLPCDSSSSTRSTKTDNMELGLIESFVFPDGQFVAL